MAAIRLALTRILRARWGAVARNVLVIDDGGPAFDLPYASRFETDGSGISPANDDPAMLDRMGRLLVNQEQVIVSCPKERREGWAAALRSAGVDGQIVSDDAADAGILGIARYDGQSHVGLVVSAGPLGLRGRVFKRLFDLAIAGAGLILLAPLLVLIALAIKLQDGGPVLFVQQRHGRGNRYFGMLKFRTMRQDRADAEGARSTQRTDPRVTPLGRLLRRTSLDELPQLVNVLKGDMSIVGPRPHATRSQAGDKHFWEVDENYWHRHSLKPGMTGLAQVRGHRGATERERDLAIRLQSDLEYIADWSLWGDVVILARTLPVLRHENAY